MEHMSLSSRVIQIQDLDEILSFEQKRLAESTPDSSEATFATWSARWRKESLEHYLPLGWSFLIRDVDVKTPESPEGALMGYILAQPFLFLEGQMQCLWVEHISYTALQARDELCDLAYRISREKHFQRVLFPNNSGVMNSIAGLKPEVWQPTVISVKTTKAM
ncbi:MAG: hypothetical protein ACK5WZ_12240 [Pseudobdellovibrionaceae bacterium]